MAEAADTAVLNIAEELGAAEGRLTALDADRFSVLAEIGEKALPELRDREEFAGQIGRLDGIEKESAALKERAEALKIEKERLEREERERIASLTCYACKTVNPDGAKFCEECGAKLGEPPREYCRACATMNMPNMKFCGECGTKL
ncbi:MAG: zinc ribbon domain-containing protein [Firmicutes bacterium]|nr:zinc ribbon domain-containing protein [Bacillota bacterium]